MTESDRQDRSPAIAELLDDAYLARVDVDTASRHLWAIHREAARLAELDPEPRRRELVGAGSGAGRRTVPRAAVPLLVLVMVMSSSGMALAASQSSLPGDVLYSVKRGTEQAQLIFARSPEARAQLQLSFARTRLDEIRQIVTTRPQHVPSLVAAINVTLSEVESATPEAAPVSDRIRREVADLDLQSAPADVAVAPGQAPTPTSPAPSATPVPTVTTPPLESVTATDVPTAVPTPTAPTQTPTEGATAQPSPTTTARPTEGGTGAPSTPASEVATTGSPTTSSDDPIPSSTPTSTPQPTATPTPTPTTTPSDGPVVTPRPHVGDGGTSRSDDGSDDGDTAAPPAPGTGAEEPTDEPSGPIQPYTRPTEG